MTPEGQIKRSILEYLSNRGIFCWINQSVGLRGRKNNSRFSGNGTSDILGIFQGSLLAIEVKTKTGKVSERQQKFIDEINSRGGIAGVCRTIDDVEELLKRPRYDNQKSTNGPNKR
jgi:hypothetical protein